jgi:hypothetical protein
MATSWLGLPAIYTRSRKNAKYMRGQCTSKQCDIVLYEKEFCPVFSVGETPEGCYYPCEGVIAVGEIKSMLSSDSLGDAFRKIESVKALHRSTPNPRVWKSYGSKVCAHGAESEVFDQEGKYWDQIYGFILSGSVELTSGTFLDRYMRECNTRKPCHCPNLTVSLHDGLYAFLKGQSLWCERRDSRGVVHVRSEHFGYLLRQLYRITQHGRTVRVPVDGYLHTHSTGLEIDGIACFEQTEQAQ